MLTSPKFERQARIIQKMKNTLSPIVEFLWNTNALAIVTTSVVEMTMTNRYSMTFLACTKKMDVTC